MRTRRVWEKQSILAPRGGRVTSLIIVPVNVLGLRKLGPEPFGVNERAEFLAAREEGL